MHKTDNNTVLISISFLGAQLFPHYKICLQNPTPCMRPNSWLLKGLKSIPSSSSSVSLLKQTGTLLAHGTTSMWKKIPTVMFCISRSPKMGVFSFPITILLCCSFLWTHISILIIHSHNFCFCLAIFLFIIQE